MSQWAYEKGLHELGSGVYAWLQPDGGWGWSNSGLIVDSGQSLLVDTLFDMELTHEMLQVMADASGVSATDIGTIVNTHANGDHTHGNGCCPTAEIIASEASAREMEEMTPAILAQMLEAAPQMGELGEYFSQIFGRFNFAGVQERLPTRTFNGTLEVQVGNQSVELLEVGPAHTAGDVLVHLPASKTVYTGDILFIDSTPIMWAGPVANWIAACDKILSLSPEVIVPGHGPITDSAGVRRVQDYLSYINREARLRYDAGMDLRDAVFDIALAEFSAWGDAERLAVNVATLYREYQGELDAPVDPLAAFSLMAELHKKL